MLTKRQFMGLYDETVLGIRQIKNNNDKINKSIGVLSQSALHRETQAERHMVEELFQKVEQFILKMEKNYLDPDTARKIGVVKQQLRIQKDRRVQLLENVDQITMETKKKQKLMMREQQQMVNNKQRNKGSPSRNSAKSSTKNPSIEMEVGDQHNFHKRSQITDIGDQSTEGDNQKTQVNMQMSDYDLQIDRKLIHQRNQQLNHAHQRMINIQNIVNETANLAYEQGEKLDIIGQDIFHAYKNVGLANTQLDQANESQKKSKRKYITFSIILLIIVGVILFLIFGI